METYYGNRFIMYLSYLELYNLRKFMSGILINNLYIPL